MQHRQASQCLAIHSPPRWLGQGTLAAPDLVGAKHHFSNCWVSEHEPLLHGQIHTSQVTPDLWLHAVEGCDLRTCSSSTTAQEGLHIVIVLEGHVDVAFGDVSLQLPPENAKPTAAQASGALVHTNQPELFVRHWRQGKFERKLSVHVQPRLLQSLSRTCDYAHLQAIVKQHLHVQPWQPSARAVVLAERIIHSLRQDHACLLLHSRTLEFLHEAIQRSPQHSPDSSQRHTLALHQHLRMAKLKALLDTQQDHGASVSELAGELGMSPSALQRQFRFAYGASIDEYRRNQRLKYARALLEQTGCSVLEVAHASGYTSAANFSTAFKRCFGISPKLVRAKL